jgi:hypothetical protein
MAWGQELLEDLGMAPGLLVSFLMMYGSGVVMGQKLESQGRFRGSAVGLCVFIQIWTSVTGFAFVITLTWAREASTAFTWGLIAGAQFATGSVAAAVLGVTVVYALPPRRRSGPTSTARYRAAAALTCISVLLYPLSIVAAATFFWVFREMSLGLIGASLALAVAIILMARTLARAARRLSVPVLDPSCLRQQPVLYLRPFDEEHRLFAAEATFEEFLYEEMTTELGPLVALGNPTDRVVPLGALRVYQGDRHWQQAVEELAATSRCVVGSTTSSPNTSWELRRLRELGLHSRLFLLSPPDLESDSRQAGSDHSASVMRRSWRSLRSIGTAWSNNDADALTRSMAFGKVPLSLSPLQVLSWSTFSAVLAEAGYQVGVPDPGPGSIVAFDSAGCAQTILTGARSAGEYVDAIQRHLQRVGNGS